MAILGAFIFMKEGNPKLIGIMLASDKGMMD